MVDSPVALVPPRSLRVLSPGNPPPQPPPLSFSLSLPYSIHHPRNARRTPDRSCAQRAPAAVRVRGCGRRGAISEPAPTGPGLIDLTGRWAAFDTSYAAPHFAQRCPAFYTARCSSERASVCATEREREEREEEREPDPFYETISLSLSLSLSLSPSLSLPPSPSLSLSNSPAHSTRRVAAFYTANSTRNLHGTSSEHFAQRGVCQKLRTAKSCGPRRCPTPPPEAARPYNTCIK
jgi:hypothetical protein